MYPLLPDFRDLSPSNIDLIALNEPSLLDSRRSLVLTLLNSIRNSYGVPSLYLDGKLNDLAQGYSSKLVQYRYVGHTDPQGNSPNQRAAAAGIQEGVG